MSKTEADWESGFEKFKKKNPGATFADYYVTGAVSRIRAGRELASLGPSLRPNDGKSVEFDTAGKSTFQRYAKLAALRPEQKVVDYGCGSLRIGLHFIRFLQPGHYFGLDVTRDFIGMGEELIGKTLLAEKQPKLSAIDTASLTEAEAFQTDLVISNAVCCHVHPDETKVYFGNLRRLCAKAGAIVFFNAMLAPVPTRYHRSGWAWPLAFYVEQLKPLRFVRAHGDSRVTDERASKGELSGTTLEFHNV